MLLIDKISRKSTLFLVLSKLSPNFVLTMTVLKGLTDRPKGVDRLPEKVDSPPKIRSFLPISTSLMMCFLYPLRG